MKRKKVALYDPYLDTLGGGERHILSVMQVLERERSYEPSVFWHQDLGADIASRLGLRFEKLTFRSSLFTSAGTSLVDRMLALREFDIFLYVTDGSYFFSGARDNVVFSMVPRRDLYPSSLVSKLKTANYRFVCNSDFTRHHLATWGIHADVLYPYLAQPFIDRATAPTPATRKKQNTILTVGRFFDHLHSKRQDIAIEAFRELRKIPSFKGSRLVLAGSALPSDMPFVEKLRGMIGDDPDIELALNIPFEDLLTRYDDAKYYWHFAGYGIDEEAHPEQTEHLGITPLEAMAAGCIPFCYAAGGPREIIRPGTTGFLFAEIPELLAACEAVDADSAAAARMVRNARDYVIEHFTYERFAANVLRMFPDLS
jgi:glycosyltransferase involved in cell wall biosynthesis